VPIMDMVWRGTAPTSARSADQAAQILSSRALQELAAGFFHPTPFQR